LAKLKIFGLRDLGAIEGVKGFFLGVGVSGFLKEYAEIWILENGLQ
jgi:hypothetical protein